VLAAPTAGPASNYDGSHGYDSPNRGVHGQDTLGSVYTPHLSSPSNSTVSIHSSSAGYTPSYPAPIQIPISQPGEQTQDFVTVDSRSPTNGIHRPHLPFHLAHNEPQRQEQSYLVPVTSTPDMMRPPLAIVDHMPQPQNNLYEPRPWDSHGWLFEETPSDQLLMGYSQNQTYPHPLEVSHFSIIGDNKRSSHQPIFHPLGEIRAQIMNMLSDTHIHPATVGEAAMQRYLHLYWTEFHPMFPLLHKPTFIREMKASMLMAIILAIGASYADPDANNLSMALYDKVKTYIMNVSSPKKTP
jgi:hypothetical protein